MSNLPIYKGTNLLKGNFDWGEGGFNWNHFYSVRWHLKVAQVLKIKLFASSVLL